MTQRFTTGKAFTTGEQVTAQDLENIVELSTPLTALTDDQTLTVNNGQVIVKDGSSTNGVPLAKMKHIAARSVVANTGNSTASPTTIQLDAYKAVLGNANGDGLTTGLIDTNNVEDDAITLDKTSFISGTTATMTLTGTAPRIILDDTGNSGDSPEINGNSTDGNLLLLAEKTGADINVDADDNVILKHNGTEGLRVSADAATDASGNTGQPGALVTGDLQVTADINVGGAAKIAGDVTITDPSPRLTFNDTTVTNTSPFIEGSNDGHLVLYTRESGSDINLDAEHEVIMKSNNGSTVVFRASDTSSKDAQGNTGQQGIKVEGDIWATSDIRADGVAKIPTIQDNVTIQGSAPIITFNDSDNSGSSPTIGGDSDFGNLSLNALQNGAEVNTYSGGALRFQVGQDVSKDAANSASAGIRSKNDIYAEGDISADGDVVASLSSDKRLKDNIAPIENATSKVNKLSGNTFIWNDKSKYSGSDVGVIAQEVQEIIPSAVKETEEGYLKVEYTKIVPLLIESIKELSAKVQELEAKVK